MRDWDFVCALWLALFEESTLREISRLITQNKLGVIKAESTFPLIAHFAAVYTANLKCHCVETRISNLCAQVKRLSKLNL